MPIFRYLLGINAVILNLFVASCTNSDVNSRKWEADASKNVAEQLKHTDDYDERINNIFAYIRKAGFAIQTDNCHKIYILQPNLCNVCSEETVKSILDSARSLNTSLVFILGDENKELEKQIRTTNINAKVFVDTSNLLEQHNLFFLKNLFIVTCANKVNFWAFK